jgi:outer membrane protein with beta-barrel domain
MKKYVLSAALLIALSISAKAQFSLGIKGGVNYSSIDADNLKSSSVAGYQIGAFVRLGTAVYLQPEAYVSSEGGKFEANDNSFSGNVKFTNLNIPVLVGVKFGPKNLNFRVMAGPMYSSVLSHNESFPQNFTNTFNNNFDHYKSSNVGYQAGFGVDLGPITADLRYQGKFSNIDENYNQQPHLWALSVGFKIL